MGRVCIMDEKRSCGDFGIFIPLNPSPSEEELKVANEFFPGRVVTIGQVRDYEKELYSNGN